MHQLLSSVTVLCSCTSLSLSELSPTRFTQGKNTTIGNSNSIILNRFLLGLGGIVIVLASVGSALGITALFGFQVSLISAEVVPFLILAIGVDNMFIIAGTFARLSKDTDIPTRMGETLKDVN